MCYMRNPKPPLGITNQMINYVEEIAELAGKLSAVSSASELFMVLWPSSRTPFP